MAKAAIELTEKTSKSMNYRFALEDVRIQEREEEIKRAISR